MIIKVKVDGQTQYRVLSKKGHNFGTYTTKAKAEERLAQIEDFKQKYLTPKATANAATSKKTT